MFNGKILKKKIYCQ